ncbi:amidohydrolase family protein [Nocardia rhamnosiphila]|uniref:Amidohydrolase family protein n=1 Tax=Nocardia rhamnosiphila TaxID=426716 RepID=A0ABV2X2G4_9NOCA
MGSICRQEPSRAADEIAPTALQRTGWYTINIWDLHVHAIVEPRARRDAAYSLLKLHEQGINFVVYIERLIHEHAVRATRQVPVGDLRAYGPSEEAVATQMASFEAVADTLARPSWLRWFAQAVAGVGVHEREFEQWASEGCSGFKVAIPGDMTEWPVSYHLCRNALNVAARRDLPVTIHVEVSRAPWIRDLLDEFTQSRVSIAHFGYSRKRLADILLRYENVYTDTANLEGPAKSDVKGYTEFITEFSSQVVLGSDAFLGNLSASNRHIDFFSETLDEKTWRAISVENTNRFLGNSGIL